MKPWWNRPTWWLAASCLMISMLLAVTGHFEPHVQGDTQSYRDFDLSSLRAALAHPRTFGYPLLLRFAEALGGDEWVPRLQWAAQVAAAWIFYGGLRCAGFRGMIALFATWPLLLSRSVFQFVPQLTGDLLAISLALATSGCLLALLAGRHRALAASGFVFFTFMTYQVRPAYLFVVPLWPLLAALFDRLLFRRDASSHRWRRVGLIALGTFVPLLAFCAVRWAVVGHFGLVSFGGYNVVGIAGQILDPPLAEELPADLRPLARDILRRRRQLPHYQVTEDFATMEAQYGDVVWNVAYPAAESLYGENRVPLNRALTRVSHEILRRRPAAYVRWLVGNTKHAVKEIHFLLLLDPGCILAAWVLLMTHFVRLLRGPQANAPRAFDEHTTRDTFREQHLLLWMALAFAAAKIALVILVEPAIARYMMGAMLFVPATLGALAGRYAFGTEPVS